MKKTIFLTDLDDTLFSSMRKAVGPVGPAVTTAKNGHHSHMSPAQEGLYDLMRAAGEVIPVTARSSDAFARVHLDFGTKRAILANGAVILGPDGKPDQDWLTYTSGIGRSAERVMEGMVASITEEFGETSRSWVVTEYGAPIYFCVKMNLEDPEEIRVGLMQAAELLADRFDLEGFQHHVNGNNLSFTPNGISKREACLHLIPQLGERSAITLMGVGDSNTDVPFMSLCDHLITPSGSQIAGRVLLRSQVGEAEDA
jgi:hydroxymethylpyrimidine pyrophosphatase-like HAD family hydrolase